MKKKYSKELLVMQYLVILQPNYEYVTSNLRK